jgi:Transposase IS116/IS110/IS902 family
MFGGNVAVSIGVQALQFRRIGPHDPALPPTVLLACPAIGGVSGSDATCADVGQLRSPSPRLAKTGNSRLRHALYLPAIVAIRHNPAVHPLAERLRARGKRPMVIVGAAMRKLLHLNYGVLKSGKPFDPTVAIAA